MRCCLPVSLVLYGMPCYTLSFPSAVWWPVCVRLRAETALHARVAFLLPRRLPAAREAREARTTARTPR